MRRSRATSSNYRLGGNPYSNVLPRINITSALSAASKSNDLVPPRPEDKVAGELGNRFIADLTLRLRHGTYEPTRSYEVTVQKANLTTRHASLLPLVDRVVYTALVAAIGDSVERTLLGPEVVLWPRGEPRSVRWDDFAASIVRSGVSFVVASDITEFYASIEHGQLGNAIARATGSQDLSDALVDFLSKVLGSKRGLPQGIAASDTLSTLYLASLDDALAQAGLHHVRYGDDIRLAASDYSSARRAVLRLEKELRRLGLHMNGEKTRIYPKKAYVERIHMYDRRFHEARERRVQAELDSIAENEDLLEDAIGTERMQELWLNSLYRDEDALQEVIEELRDTIEPEKTEIAEDLFVDIFQKRPGTTEAIGRVAFDRCLRSSLILLMAGKSDVALKYAGDLLTEVPHHTKMVCRYLAAMQGSGTRVTMAIAQAMSTYTTESELAWLIRVLHLVADDMPDDLVREAREVMEHPHEQWLAAVEAAKLMGTRGELGQEGLMSLWGACPEVFKTDLVVAATRMEKHQPWASAWVEGTKSDVMFERVAKLARTS